MIFGPLPISAARIYDMRRTGSYHPVDCSSRQGGWCDCGGFTTDAEEWAWCEAQAALNRRNQETA